MNYKSIAIDGPSGAGKSTLARRVAEEMKFIYVDTGAIYRTVGLAAKRAGLKFGENAAVAALLPGLHIKVAYDGDGKQRMYLNGEDVSDAIREPEIAMYASDVSAMPAVREFLMEMQRSMARHNDVIMDGRDIGTVVLPDAQLKIFLTAAPEIRAERRYLELLDRDDKSSFENVLSNILTRDKNDSTRAIAPLRRAPDAVLLDTSELDFEQSLEAIINLIKVKYGL
ncbi:MAG: (d)CMP kinase [Oscillospiraceae bacterium]